MEQKGLTQRQHSSGEAKTPPLYTTTTNYVLDLKTLVGVVERITFQAADTGYTVA